MSDILGERNLEQRLTEIRGAIERMDFRWDQGFITDKADYLEKRVKLQQKLEQLSPIPDDDLERAPDMLTNFRHYWEACNDDFEEQHRLIKLIVERVYVQDEAVVAMTLKADYHVVLGNKANEPTQVSVDSPVYTFGDDGVRYLLCIKSICFRHSRFGGRNLRQNRQPNLIIVISERTSRSVLFSRFISSSLSAVRCRLKKTLSLFLSDPAG